MTPRPAMNAEIARQASEQIVARMVTANFLKADQANDSAVQIAKHFQAHMDGYELAKRLDDFEHWDCNFKMVEILNDLSWVARDLLEKAEKAWLKSEQPSPPFAVGDRIAFGRRGETGKITGIDVQGLARFLVAVDGDPAAHSPSQSSRLVKFEDARATEAVSA